MPGQIWQCRFQLSWRRLKLKLGRTNLSACPLLPAQDENFLQLRLWKAHLFSSSYSARCLVKLNHPLGTMDGLTLRVMPYILVDHRPLFVVLHATLLPSNFMDPMNPCTVSCWFHAPPWLDCLLLPMGTSALAQPASPFAQTSAWTGFFPPCISLQCTQHTPTYACFKM